MDTIFMNSKNSKPCDPQQTIIQCFSKNRHKKKR